MLECGDPRDRRTVSRVRTCPRTPESHPHPTISESALTPSVSRRADGCKSVVPEFFKE